MRFGHVVFDLDGTLVDSGADLAASMNHVLRSLGRDALPTSTLVGYVGDGARMLVARALGASGAADLDVAFERFLAYYGGHLLDATRAYPGVPELLARLASHGVVMDVLTNKPAAMSEAILDGLGLRARFREVLGGDSLATRKPDPAGLDRLCRSAGVARDRTLVVGDSPVDLQTAAAAQVAFCGVGWGLDPRLRVARPPRLVEEPAALLEVVIGG